MTCSSFRTIGELEGSNPTGGGTPVPRNGQKVQCIRPSGHPGTWHHGLLADLTTIGWEGYPDDKTVETTGQEVMDFGE